MNINIPQNYKGIKVAPLGLRTYNENVETVIDKKGNLSYRLSGKYIPSGKKNGTDIDIVDKGYISVTPLQINQTDFTFIKKIKL